MLLDLVAIWQADTDSTVTSGRCFFLRRSTVAGVAGLRFCGKPLRRLVRFSLTALRFEVGVQLLAGAAQLRSFLRLSRQSARLPRPTPVETASFGADEARLLWRRHSAAEEQYLHGDRIGYA